MWLRQQRQRALGRRLPITPDRDGHGTRAATEHVGAAGGGDLGGRRRHPLPAPRGRAAPQGAAGPAQGPRGPRCRAAAAQPTRSDWLPRRRPGADLPVAARLVGRASAHAGSAAARSAGARPAADAVRWRDAMSDIHRRRSRLPRPRRHHPDAPGGRRGDDGAPRRRRQPQLAARLRPARPPGRGGVPRDDRAGARLPARRGRLHLRRHRVRQPRAQGHLLGPARRRPAPHPHPLHRDRAPRRARPAALARRATRAPRSSCCRSTSAAGSTSTRCAPRVERDPGVGRAGLGDVGQQRGRHPAADRRGRRDRRRRTASRSTPTPSRRSARCRSTSPPPASTR